MTSPRPDILVPLLRSGEAARPRLIWHAPGERIELSGRVLATWASKSADMLQEEFDLGPGGRVRLDGTPHWRLLVWALGAWTIGGHVLTTGDETVDVLVTDADRAAQPVVGADTVIALTRAALARRSTVELPAGVVDEAATLLSYADVMEPYDSPASDAPALDALTFGTLIRSETADRVHVCGTTELHDVLRASASIWAAGGSVVLTDPAWEAGNGGDPEGGAYARTLAEEGVTRRLR